MWLLKILMLTWFLIKVWIISILLLWQLISITCFTKKVNPSPIHLCIVWYLEEIMRTIRYLFWFLENTDLVKMSLCWGSPKMCPTVNIAQWLKMSWHQIGTMPSATTIPALLSVTIDCDCGIWTINHIIPMDIWGLSQYKDAILLA